MQHRGFGLRKMPPLPQKIPTSFLFASHFLGIPFAVSQFAHHLLCKYQNFGFRKIPPLCKILLTLNLASHRTKQLIIPIIKTTSFLFQQSPLPVLGGDPVFLERIFHWYRTPSSVVSPYCLSVGTSTWRRR